MCMLVHEQGHTDSRAHTHTHTHMHEIRHTRRACTDASTNKHTHTHTHVHRLTKHIFPFTWLENLWTMFWNISEMFLGENSVPLPDAMSSVFSSTDIWHIVGSVPAEQACELWGETHQGTDASLSLSHLKIQRLNKAQMWAHYFA